MAGESNIIEVLIKSVDSMSADLRRIQGEMGRLDTPTGKTSGTFGAATQSSAGLFRQMGPLRSVLVQLTGVTGSFGTAIFNLVRFGLTPAVLAITGIIAITTALISKWVGGTKEVEEFNKQLSGQHEVLATLNIEYRALTRSITDSEAAVQKFRTAQNAQLQDQVDQLAKWRSIIGALPGGKDPISQFMRGLFGLSDKDLKDMEDRLSVPQGLGNAQAKALKRNIVTGETEKSSQAEKEWANKIEEVNLEMAALLTTEQAAALAAIDHAEAVAMEKAAFDELSVSVQALIVQYFEGKRGLIAGKRDAKKAAEEVAAATKMWDIDLAELNDTLRQNTELIEHNRKKLEDEINVLERLGQLEAENLEIQGRSMEAQRRRLESEVENLKKRKKLVEDAFGDTRIVDQQITNAQDKLAKLGLERVIIKRKAS